MTKITLSVEIIVSDGKDTRIGHALMSIDIQGESSIIDGKGIVYPRVVAKDKLMQAFMSGDTSQFLRVLADVIEWETSEETHE